MDEQKMANKIYNKRLGKFVTEDGYRAMMEDLIEQYTVDSTMNRWIEHNCPEDPGLVDPVNQLAWEKIAAIMAEDDLTTEGWY